jgi:hypothetical protein
VRGMSTMLKAMARSIAKGGSGGGGGGASHQARLLQENFPKANIKWVPTRTPFKKCLNGQASGCRIAAHCRVCVCRRRVVRAL